MPESKPSLETSMQVDADPPTQSIQALTSQLTELQISQPQVQSALHPPYDASNVVSLTNVGVGDPIQEALGRMVEAMDRLRNRVEGIIRNASRGIPTTMVNEDDKGKENEEEGSSSREVVW